MSPTTWSSSGTKVVKFGTTAVDSESVCYCAKDQNGYVAQDSFLSWVQVKTLALASSFYITEASPLFEQFALTRETLEMAIHVPSDLNYLLKTR